MSPTSTPSIRISEHQRYASPPSYPGSQPDTAAPMPIPKAQEGAPPPLPPPTHIPEITGGKDPGWQWGNDPSSSNFGRAAAVKPGSSLLGAGTRNPLYAKELEHTGNGSMDDGRRGSSLSTVVGITRDHEMPDAQQQSDDEGSRTGSSYRYVRLVANAALNWSWRCLVIDQSGPAEFLGYAKETIIHDPRHHFIPHRNNR